MQDSFISAQALAANASRLGLAGKYSTAALTPDAFAHTELILARLPRAHSALAYTLEVLAASAATYGVNPQFVGGGMVKHLSLALNQELQQLYPQVHASLARGKARVIHATTTAPSSPLLVPPTPPRFPQERWHDGIGLKAFAYGAVFGGASLDQGTALLLRNLEKLPLSAPPREVLDLGCGSGLIASAAARHWPTAQILATDVSAQAVASTRLTAQHAQFADRVHAFADDAAAQLPANSLDLVLCNPPFHNRGEVLGSIAAKMFRAAARVLRPGGTLVCVYNTTLPYFPQLNQLVGPTQVLANDAKFTLSAATRRHAAST